MKPVSPELLTLFATRRYFQVDLWKIDLANGGGRLLYTNGDVDVTGDGELYSAGGQTGPYFDRSGSKAKCSWRVGTEVDTLTFDVIPGAAMIGSLPFLQACYEGIFDGAKVQLLQANMPTYGDTRVGLIRKFIGLIAQPDPIGQSFVTFTVNSKKQLLNQQLPRNVYESGCLNNLGDTACGVNINAFKENCAAAAGCTPNKIVAANVAGNAPAGLYNLGMVLITSGALNGNKRTVRTCGAGANANITLLNPLPGALGVGDTFTLYQGCDKSLTGVNGCPKFYNATNVALRYRGQPFIPQPVVGV